MKRRVAVILTGLVASSAFLVGASADEIAVADLYIGDDATVWQESNDVDGLQREATDQDGDGINETEPDDQLL